MALASEGLDLQMLANFALEDIRSIMAAPSSSDQDDQSLALAEYEKELVELLQVLDDHEMSRNVNSARTAHYRAVAEAHREELQAVGDRALARRLGGLPVEGEPETTPQIPGAWTDADTELCPAEPGVEDQLNSLTRLVIPLFANEEETIHVECVACTGYHPLNEVFETDCDHNYCFSCLAELYQSAAKDEELFPVRCCKRNIPLERVQNILPAGLTELYEEKATEYLTSDRVYCSDPACSKFIRPDAINKATNTGVCSECSKVTCSLCKKASHTGKCPADANTQALLNVATENGWKRCYKCHTMIELVYGCNHMV